MLDFRIHRKSSIENFNDMNEQIKLIPEVMMILEFLRYNNYIYIERFKTK